eukprot:731704-Hanusia_phi.AAC.1
MLLTGDARTVKIGDFGLSRKCPHASPDGASTDGPGGEDAHSAELTGTAGTYRYMAPEIFRGEA